MSNLKVAAQDREKGRFKVVVNNEEQFSIWSAAREVPAGWREEGYAGSEEACLRHIDQVWTNMIPLSLRSAIANTAEPRLSDADNRTGGKP